MPIATALDRRVGEVSDADRDGEAILLAGADPATSRFSCRRAHRSPPSRRRCANAGSAVSGREQLGGVRHHRDPPSHDGAPSRRRSHRSSSRWSPRSGHRLYGCSDVELLRLAVASGGPMVDLVDTRTRTMPLRARRPSGRRVAPASWVAWRDGRRRMGRRRSALAQLVDERRALDAALDRPDARDVWRRIRYVIDQARAWSDAGGHGLRRYLAWVHLLASESRNADTILPEHDDDAVRIMTVHAAKGLEFPITIVSGMTTKPRGRPMSNAVVWHRDTWTISNTARAPTRSSRTSYRSTSR